MNAFTISVVALFAVFFILIIVLKKDEHKVIVLKAFMIIFFGGFAVVGLMALWTALDEYSGGSIDGETLLVRLPASLLLFLIGVIPLYWFFGLRKKSSRNFERAKKEHPQEPWLWYEGWRKERMVYTDKGGMILAWIVTVVFYTVLPAVLYLNRAKVLERYQASKAEFVFGALVIGFFFVFLPIGFSINTTRRWIRFGYSRFEPETLPAYLGAQIKGSIQTRIRSIPRKGFEVRLACYRVLSTGRDNVGNRSSEPTESLLFDAEKKIKQGELTMGPGGVRIPVLIDIPENVPESDMWSPGESIEWKLTAIGKMAEGVSYYSAFEVPVFRKGR